ncbi:flippase [Rhodocaloribacter sp.]
MGHSDAAGLAKGAGITLFGRLAGRGTLLLSQALLARFLGPESFGLYAIGWTLLNMVGLVAVLGLDSGVIYYGARYWRTDTARFKGTLLQSLGLALASGLCIGGVLILLAPWLAEDVFQKPALTGVFRWFAPAFMFLPGMRVAAAATRISKRMLPGVVSEDVTPFVTNLLLIVVFYWMGWQLMGAVTAAVISFGMGLLVGVFYVHKLYPQVFSQRTKAHFRVKVLLAFSLPTLLANAFTFISVRIDRLLVGGLRSAAETGLYQTATQSAILFGIVVGSFSTIFMPMIADLYGKREIDRLGELFKISTKWGLYVSLPLFLIMVVAPEDVLNVLFGRAYEAAAPTLRILALGQLVNAATGAVGPLMIMTGHPRQWFYISSVMLVVNVVLNLLLVPTFGIAGAAIANVCALGGLFISGLLWIRVSLNIWPYDRRYGKGLVGAILTLGALLLVRSLHMEWAFLNLAVMTVMAVLVFGGALLMFGLADEDKEVISLVAGKLKRLGSPRSET